MPLVFDISSDDEEGLEQVLSMPDFDFIREFLSSSEEESDISDEAVVVHQNKPELKSKSPTLAVKVEDGDDGDDDDCVILEGDPEKGAAPVAEEANGSDELLVIGEKGPIACRDYPHPRHLCAKFPFSSTPHEKHCSQCHCYVCDSLAPCLEWGTGILSSDHCHANDKTELWKIQRKKFRLGQSSPLPASTNFGTSLRPGHPQCNEFLPPGVSHLSPNSVLPNQVSRSTATCTIPSVNSIPQIQASRPTITHSLSASSPNSRVQNQVSRPINTLIMSTATNITMLNGANHGGSRESRSTLARNRYQPLVLGVRSHAIQRERGNGASSLRPQLLRPHLMPSGGGSAGNTMMVNNSSHGSSGLSNHVNMTQQCHNYYPATGFSNCRNRNGSYDVCRPTNISFYSQPSSQPASLSCVNQHTVASETQVYSQPLPQSNSSQNFYQTRIQVNDAPSSYAARLNEPQIRSQNGNASGNTTLCGTRQPQPQPHEESARETAGKVSAFVSSWTGTTGQSILQSSGSAGQAPNVKESGTGSNEPLIELPSSIVDLESWLLDKDYFPVVTDGVLPSDLSIPSPDLDPVDDMDMVFYYLDGE
ncbi:31 kDa ribonucleoprotein [Spatholobus suberectus]|nr:31 kDa ribonucleoprotein [Spatholobus suberectus]